jgi:hypothetical protein
MHESKVTNEVRILSAVNMRLRRLLKLQLQRIKGHCTTRASFLDLPPEIRFQIYDIVKDFNLAYRLELDDPCQSLKLRLHFPGLARYCRIVAEEIRYHRSHLPRKERYATVVVRYVDGESFLTHAPYPIADLKKLNIVYDVSCSTFVESKYRNSGAGRFLSTVMDDLFSHGRFATIMRVRVFAHVRKDGRKPLDDWAYESSVKLYRDILDREIVIDREIVKARFEERVEMGIPRMIHLTERDYKRQSSECPIGAQQELTSRKKSLRFVDRWSCGLTRNSTHLRDHLNGHDLSGRTEGGVWGLWNSVDSLEAYSVL